MGLRGEVFSTRMVCEGRTYFFNVKENRTGDLFLAIVESKPNDTGTSFERRSIVVFKDHMPDFLKAFEKSLDAMEKAPGSKPPRKAGPRRERDGERSSERPSRPAASERDAAKPRRSQESFSLLPEGQEQPKRRVIRANPKAKPAAESAPKTAKPAGKRLTVKKAEPKD